MFLGLAVVGAAGVGAYLLLAGDDDAKPAEPTTVTARQGVVPKRAAQGARTELPPTAEAEAEVAPPVDLSDPSPGVKKWKEPGLPGTFREIVAPDDSENLEEKLTYKMRRLRFRLTDAAAECYAGEDSKQQVAIEYTLVVKGGELSAEDVRPLDSNITDRNLENCIINSVKTLRSSAPGIEDLRKQQRTVISLHDLWVRNRASD